MVVEKPDDKPSEIEVVRQEWFGSFENDLGGVRARRTQIIQHLQREDLTDASRQQSLSWLREHDKQWVSFLILQRFQQETTPALYKEVDRHNAAGRMALRGGRAFLVGGTITAVTYLAAPETGFLVIGWGGVLFGGLFFLIGIVRLLVAKRALRPRPDPAYVKRRVNELGDEIEAEEEAKGTISPRSL